MEKKIITSGEAAAFVRQMVYKTLAREDMKALVDLLREKGVVTGDEAAAFIQKLAKTPTPEEEKRPAAQAPVAKIAEANNLVLLAGDKEFIRQLRELWIKKGNRGSISTPSLAISRMWKRLSNACG
jgi:polyhydroxyalkanoate synthesis regulator phasin